MVRKNWIMLFVMMFTISCSSKLSQFGIGDAPLSIDQQPICINTTQDTAKVHFDNLSQYHIISMCSYQDSIGSDCSGNSYNPADAARFGGDGCCAVYPSWVHCIA